MIRALQRFSFKNNSVSSMMNRMKSTEVAPAEYSTSMKGTFMNLSLTLCDDDVESLQVSIG